MNWLDGAIAGGAAVSAALIAGCFTWLVSKDSRDRSARAAADAQLREARRLAAEDIRSLADLGAVLAEAVAAVRDNPDDQHRETVTAACASIATRAEFIWDDELKTRMADFTDYARKSANATFQADVQTNSTEAARAWIRARERSATVWRELMLEAVNAGALMASSPGQPDALCDQ